MAHPKETRRLSGKVWHLEDQNLTRSDADALVRHLKKTEDKKARKKKTDGGYQVWWSK